MRPAKANEAALRNRTRDFSRVLLPGSPERDPKSGTTPSPGRVFEGAATRTLPRQVNHCVLVQRLNGKLSGFCGRGEIGQRCS